MAKESEKIDDLDISVAVLNNEELEEYNLEFGVKITHVHPGVISEATDILVILQL